MIILFIKKDRMTDKASNLWKIESDTAVSEDGMKFNAQGNSVL